MSEIKYDLITLHKVYGCKKKINKKNVFLKKRMSPCAICHRVRQFKGLVLRNIYAKYLTPSSYNVDFRDKVKVFC